MTSLLTDLVAQLASGAIRVVDLANTLSSDFPVIVLPSEFGQCEPFRMETVSRYDADGPAWYWNRITMNEHTGTHFDAPAHWITGRDVPHGTVDAVAARDFVYPAVVIDISAAAAADADFVVTRAFLEHWESRHGAIPPRHWILLRSDWSKRVGTLAYLNLQDDGAHSPGPDADAMRFLVHARDCVGLGVETVGTDAGQASHFAEPLPAHSILHGNGRFGLQCLTNLDQLPTFGSVIVAAPLKIKGGSGSPLRVIALMPEA
ncbi:MULTISPECIES: cyclase family protein [unclassified Novosphingobium]|uniref:cyclase family protein n=1 Tax=unclassified Novosphingobium TaxID=2644732 RepID=UPI0003B38770|nr:MULTISPECIES: cyclase family protein [unclassified Novosphingobium]MBB3357200.1 kynurenine formamidase [Novosphingobium sp. BK256]MBB3374138.1 kynurenine formamidase [Novosphingobium sp. BK280]MBB3378550.1 kynurenine formamidase [Novosphingobium sp. BK258]MBB3419666.1 kynurenine formamidase [Novosphingobium sp. BK267]MBB3448013.1 kynurenine formamidase [Novosphingobium sp. BK352]